MFFIYKLTFLFLTPIFGLFGQATDLTELVITGKYQGKNIFVQNPLADNSGIFCIEQIYINDKLHKSKISASAVEVNLSTLSQGEFIFVRIVHKEGCLPKVINPQVVRIPTNFKFIAIHLDSDELNWVFKDAPPNAHFMVEERDKNSSDWKNVKKMKVDSKPGQVLYQASINLSEKQEKRFRVFFENQEGYRLYSDEIVHHGDKEPVTFYPQRVDNKITLSRVANYEIVDSTGKLVTKGEGNEILLEGASSGLYFLNIENRTEKFFKK
ncbi:MAG: T9SS type A sorting domain-containing protein [Cyclobacteriaceae bacterium]|nr:T9SS type A sorting domain-containing protein [Cyclobacteriaceae bacterium]MCH8517060.1 T9SS type A sorting domain-containing protein [Cyclobacteriaceae bacterium]